MAEHKHEPGKSRNFSLAFEQMCSFVAIASTKNADETLRELIMQCLVILPDERFETPQHIANVLDVLFGIQIPQHEIETGLDVLEAGNLIQRPTGSNYTLPLEVRARLQERIIAATALEDKVRQEWLQEISAKYSISSPEQMWAILREYLAKAFRRHGIQTAALLDTSVDIDAEHASSLGALLKEALKGTPFEQQSMARSAIASFFASVSNYPDRATYIAQLADGAFNYFSLTFAPDVAERFRHQLSPLSLFLDTNFLFGILGLSANSQVEVSNELLQAIEKYNLPFGLLYHRRTEQEIVASLNHHKDVLLSRIWPRSISRAATTSRYMNGIELMYHERHAETGVDVATFFRPYEHIDIILHEKNIATFRPSEDRLHQRAHLLNEYKDWLEKKGRVKSYNVIDHDTTVLDQARQLRSDATTSLEAGALLITCDYNLFRFDWETSRAQGRAASTVLPNLFWQTLRPFVPADSDFDRSFAETFAIPEFRTIGSGASTASSKLLYILASYKDLPEETATKILSNDLLIDSLRCAENDQKFQEYVEAAIVAENAALVEEKAAMQTELERERAAKALIETEKAEADRAHLQSEESLQAQHESARERADRAEKEAEQQRKGRELAEKETEQQRKAREHAEKRAAGAESEKAIEKARADLYAGFTKVVLGSLLTVALFELLVNILPWKWLIAHPQSYGLQFSFDIVLICLNVAVFIRRWRTGSLVGIIVAFGAVIAQLLGGPPLQP